jgi:hypothetical protein
MKTTILTNMTSITNEEAASLACDLNLPDGEHALLVVRVSGSHVASTKEWLPTPQECDEYNPETEKLKARRARLLESIDDIECCQMDQPMNEAFDAPLQDLKDELAAVESELGKPEPKEPEEA